MFSDTDEAEFSGGSDCSDGLQTDLHGRHRCAVVSLDNASSDAVMAMVHYIYTGSCVLQHDHIEEICWLADRFATFISMCLQLSLLVVQQYQDLFVSLSVCGNIVCAYMYISLCLFLPTWWWCLSCLGVHFLHLSDRHALILLNFVATVSQLLLLLFV